MEQPSGWESRLRARWDETGLAVVVALYLVLCGLSFPRNAITVDEGTHLASGLNYLHGSFKLETFNSPLPRMIASLPLLFDRNIVLPPVDPKSSPGDLFSYTLQFSDANYERYFAMFQPARAMVVLLGALTVVITFFLCRPIFGRASALAAAAFLALDPTFMAHSGLMTTDIPTTAATVAAVFGMRRFILRPAVGSALLAGALLAAATLSKVTTALLPFLFVALAVFAAERRPETSRARLALLVVLALATAWLTLCAGYRFQGVGQSVGEYQFESETFKGLSRKLPAGLPIPLPRPLIQGLDTNFCQNGSVQSYLLGKTYFGGKPWYYPIAFAAKTPFAGLAFLALGAFALWPALAGRRRELWFTLAPAVTLAGFVAFVSQLNIGLRYLLPAYPMFYIMGSSWLAEGWPTDRFPSRKAATTAALALAAAALITNLASFPTYLSYFNAAAGGARNGWKVLGDSNLDWGQDLLRLKQYQERERLGRICLIYFGPVDPLFYQMDYEFPKEPERCPVLAISVQYLLGFPFMISDHGQNFIDVPPGFYSHLNTRPPDRIIGGSIWIYDQRRRPPP